MLAPSSGLCFAPTNNAICRYPCRPAYVPRRPLVDLTEHNDIAIWERKQLAGLRDQLIVCN